MVNPSRKLNLTCDVITYNQHPYIPYELIIHRIKIYSNEFKTSRKIKILSSVTSIPHSVDSQHELKSEVSEVTEVKLVK
jgi:hypothetical protein